MKSHQQDKKQYRCLVAARPQFVLKNASCAQSCLSLDCHVVRWTKQADERSSWWPLGLLACFCRTLGSPVSLLPHPFCLPARQVESNVRRIGETMHSACFFFTLVFLYTIIQRRKALVGSEKTAYHFSHPSKH